MGDIFNITPFPGSCELCFMTKEHVFIQPLNAGLSVQI